MERNGVLITIRKKSEFAIEKSELIQDLNKLIRFENGQQETVNTLPEISKTIAMSALGAAIKYLELSSDQANLGHYEMNLLNLNRYVHLDAAAVSALNIFPKPGTPMNSTTFRWQSILGVLDRCRTAQGHRLLSQWLKQPLRNEASIKDRHDIVECFIDSSRTRNELHDDYLKRMPDIMMLGKKLMRKKASLQDIFRLYQIVVRTPKILELLSDLENVAVNNVLYTPMKDTLGDLVMFKQMVEQVMDLKGIEKGEYFVKASFDETLQEFKDKMNEIEGKIQVQFGKAAKDLGLDKGTGIKLDTVSHLGYHFRISLKDDAVLRKNKNYRSIDAIKGGVRFTSDRLSELSEDFEEARIAYAEHQKTIVDEIVRISCECGFGYFVFFGKLILFFI